MSEGFVRHVSRKDRVSCETRNDRMSTKKDRHNHFRFKQTALEKMIYESSKYAKICEENVSEVFVPCVFSFVGNVTECLAVSRRFVPDNYVSTATILRVVKKKQIAALFTRRPSLSVLKFVDVNLRYFRMNKVLSRNVNIERVILVNSPECYFPGFDLQKMFYHLDLPNFTWYMRCELPGMERNIEVVYDEESIQYSFENFQLYPQFLMHKMMCSILNGGDEWKYRSIMPHFKGTQKELMQYERLFERICRCAHSYYDCKFLKESPHHHEEASTKAAVRFILGTNGPTYVAQLEKTLDIWQLVTMYEHPPMGKDWTWEESQRILV